jgi:tetratricopeptide (TPR) repeat protein
MEDCRRLFAPELVNVFEDDSLPRYHEESVIHHEKHSLIALQNQQSAVEHNNHAILLLKQGCYLEAFQLLNRALKLCRQSMADAPLRALDVNTNFPTNLDAYLTEAPVHDANDEDLFFFDQMITIPHQVGPGYRACVLVSTLVTFNFALANHLVGLAMMTRNSDNASTTSMSVHLQTASTFYQLAYSMQHVEDFPVGTAFESTVLNNLGLVHSQLGNSHAADQCWEYLWRILRNNNNNNNISSQDPTSTSTGTNITATGTHHTTRRVLRNITIWFSQTSSAAAA